MLHSSGLSHLSPYKTRTFFTTCEHIANTFTQQLHHGGRIATLRLYQAHSLIL